MYSGTLLHPPTTRQRNILYCLIISFKMYTYTVVCTLQQQNLFVFVKDITIGYIL